MTLAPGTKLGAYEILAPLGAGGMGEVYRARDTRLERDVAVKVLPEEFFEDEERRRALRAGSAAAREPEPSRTSRPSIHSKKSPVLPRSSAATSSSWSWSRARRCATRSRRSRLPAKKLLEIGAQIADGLAKAHAAGHRPPRPEARERHGVPRRLGEDPRLRPREARRSRRAGASSGDGDRVRHGPGHGHGHGRIHVSGAGERQAGGLPLGPVLSRHDPLRAGDGATRLSARQHAPRRSSPSSARSPSRSRS